MSNRPEWCPADVWDRVKHHPAAWGEVIAEAILAERERCAAIADDHGKAWGLAMGQQAHEIACAIRRDPQV